MSKVTTKAKKVTAKASASARKGASSHQPKSAGGSSLSRKKSRRVAAKSAGSKKASAVKRSEKAAHKSKSVSGSALSQVRNPRSGRFVKIDKATGRIISHKKSEGAYKGVPIARK
jgi:hypothetical protein